MFNFSKKPVHENFMSTLKEVEPAELELENLREKASLLNEKENFLFLFNLLKDTNPDVDKYIKFFTSDEDYEYVWRIFNSKTYHLYLKNCEKEVIITLVYCSIAEYAQKKVDYTIKKCKERYESYWTKREIDYMFQEAQKENDHLFKLLKIKEFYGQEVLWSQVFNDHKPFDSKDWVEEGELL